MATSFETGLLHNSGREILVEVNGGLIQYEGKPADLMVLRDITERRRLGGAPRRVLMMPPLAPVGLDDAIYALRLGWGFCR